jgi:hypothetical protein
VEEQIKQAQNELDDRNKSVTSLKPSFLAAKKTNIKIHANSKNVNNERVKLN